MQSTQPSSLLQATFFNDGKTLKTLESTGKGSQTIHALSNPNRHMTIVSHNGCPDGSWSGHVVSKLLQQRDTKVQQLLQAHPMEAPEIEVGLLIQHQAIQENSIIMTADIMFDMDTVIQALKVNDSTAFVLTDHHGGTGKLFYDRYKNLGKNDRELIDTAIEQERLIVNVNTMESGTSHIFNLLAKDMTDNQIMNLFGFQSDSQLQSYKQFMKAYDLTTMQPEAVKEFTRYTSEHVTLNAKSQAILDQCKDGISNSFIRENILHFLLCYLGDTIFNDNFHFAPEGSDPSTVVAPSFFDQIDPSYPGGKEDKNHKKLMKVHENTDKFIAEFADNFKDPNCALKKIKPEKFLSKINNANDIIKQGKPVTYNGETFFAANIQARAGRFVQALVSEELNKHPECKYAVLFEFHASMQRAMNSDIDLTEVVKDWKSKEMTKFGGGHPEAAGMQLADNQYKNLLSHCQKAGIPLSDTQKSVLTC